MLRNHILYVLYVAHGLFMFALVMLAPLFALFATNLKASVETVAFLGTIYFIAKAMSTIFTRFISANTFTPLTNLRLGYIAKIIGCIGFLFAVSVPQLFLIQFLLGFSEGLHAPAFRALMATNFDDHREMAEAAEWEIILAFTGITGTALGGLIVSMFGFDTLFTVMGTLVFIALLLTYRLR